MNKVEKKLNLDHAIQLLKNPSIIHIIIFLIVIYTQLHLTKLRKHVELNKNKVG